MGSHLSPQVHQHSISLGSKCFLFTRSKVQTLSVPKNKTYSDKPINVSLGELKEVSPFLIWKVQ